MNVKVPKYESYSPWKRTKASENISFGIRKSFALFKGHIRSKLILHT